MQRSKGYLEHVFETRELRRTGRSLKPPRALSLRHGQKLCRALVTVIEDAFELALA